MRNKLGLIAMILFILSAGSYLAMLAGMDKLILFAAVSSAVGLALGLFARHGVYKSISIAGNALILFISVVVPFVVTTFFWNRP